MIARTALAACLCVVGHQVAAEEFVMMGCTFKDGAAEMAVTINKDAQTVTYAYGPTGQSPDLQLSSTLVDVEYDPWPGVSRAIWHEVTFRNGTYAYAVGMSIDRDPLNAEVYGGISITNNGSEIAYLECDQGSGTFVYDEAISEAKAAAGLCVSRGETTTWVPCE